MSLSVELILIGNELLSGHKKDANLSWLTPFLKSKGLKLIHVQIVSDDFDHIIAAFQLAAARSKIIISSGGLGPTLDDLTKAAFAKAFQLPLKTNEAAKKLVQSHYTRFDRICDFSKNNYDQIPVGAMAIDNPVGFAPGIFYSTPQGAKIVLAPGVPREFAAMIEKSFWPKIASEFSLPAVQNLIWRTTGIAEEKIFSELSPNLWKDLEEFGIVSSLPHISGVDIGLELHDAKSDNLKIIQKIIEDAKLSPYIWTTENISLPEYLVKLAKDKKQTFSFVESCTGGFAASLITQQAGCSDVFKGGLVTYQTELKNSLLKIDPSITGESAVNQKTAELMSQKGQQLTHADLCLSFTGFAGPGGGDKENPVGRLWLGLTAFGKTESKMLDMIGSRSERIERFANAGLHMLRNALEKI